jgi:hypothetical protein
MIFGVGGDTENPPKAASTTSGIVAASATNAVDTTPIKIKAARNHKSKRIRNPLQPLQIGTRRLKDH